MSATRRAIVVGGCLAMIYTQVTTSPVMIQFARQLGANGFHIGILGALPTGLFFVQLLSALLMSRVKYRRWWWFFPSLVHRLSYIPVALGPWLFPDWNDSTWVWVLLGATCANHALLHFGSPLWLSWMGDYLPRRGLSQFWGVRHGWQQWAASLALFGCAWGCHNLEASMWDTFGLLVSVATVLGVIDLLLFLNVEEPAAVPAACPAWRSVLAAPFRDQQYRSFITYSCWWHFAAMVGAPFVSMYLLDHIGMSLHRVLVLWALSWIGGALLTKRFGMIAESYGHRPLLILCTALKMVNMAALLVTPRDPEVAFWVLVPILMMDAQLNAGINIANQGFMLKYSPQENRTMFLAAGTAVAGMIGGLTAIVAGWWLSRLEGWSVTVLNHEVVGFHLLFLVSAVLRLAAVQVARQLLEPDSQPTAVVVRDLWGSWSHRILRIPRVEIVPITQPDGGVADEAISNSLEVINSAAPAETSPKNFRSSQQRAA
ncbi:MAG: MFS transporter [Planctomycetota bacterium]